MIQKLERQVKKTDNLQARVTTRYKDAENAMQQAKLAAGDSLQDLKARVGDLIDRFGDTTKVKVEDLQDSAIAKAEAEQNTLLVDIERRISKQLLASHALKLGQVSSMFAGDI